MKVEGVYTAIVTPFTKDGKGIDVEALDNIVEAQINAGVAGLMPLGSTGEWPTVSEEERQFIISRVIEKVNGRVQVIPGAGGNCTEQTVKNLQKAKDAGADGVLVVTPYYNRPGQEGMYQHYKQLCSVGIPIIVYNNTSRTGVTMSAQTVGRLFNDFDEIVGYKEATPGLNVAIEIAATCDIAMLAGGDTFTLPMMAIGAKGVSSVLSNLDPKGVCATVQSALEGNFGESRKHYQRLFKLEKVLGIAPNPVALKAAMGLQGICNSTVRQPLWSLESEKLKELRAVLLEYGYNVQ